jgi:hypothetical protein
MSAGSYTYKSGKPEQNQNIRCTCKMHRFDAYLQDHDRAMIALPRSRQMAFVLELEAQLLQFEHKI